MSSVPYYAINTSCRTAECLRFRQAKAAPATVKAGMAAVAAQVPVLSSTVTQGAATNKSRTHTRHNCDSMMDLTRKHFYKQGERQCVLDMFN